MSSSNSSSDAESSYSSEHNTNNDIGSDNNEIDSEFLPYVDDPVADDEWSDGEGDCEDPDGLTPEILERRYEGIEIVQTW